MNLTYNFETYRTDRNSSRKKSGFDPPNARHRREARYRNKWRGRRGEPDDGKVVAGTIDAMSAIRLVLARMGRMFPPPFLPFSY